MISIDFSLDRGWTKEHKGKNKNPNRAPKREIQDSRKREESRVCVKKCKE